MKICLLVFVLAFAALAACGCNEEARLTVLFSGDEHDYITPAG